MPMNVAFLRPQHTTFGVRELTTHSSLIDCKENSNSSQNRRSGFGWPGRWPHGPTKAILGAMAGPNPTAGAPSVPGPLSVFKQVASDFDKLSTLRKASKHP